MKRSFILAHPEARRRAMACVADAPAGFAVTVSEPNRTLEQNAKFHAVCEDAARSGFKWMGKRRTKIEWKILFISGHAVATGEPTEVVGGLEGELVNIRESSANMSVKRGSSLIEYSLAFCAMNQIETEEAQPA